jgi:transcription elongation factor GreA
MNTSNKNPVTKEGYDSIFRKISQNKDILRNEVSKEIEHAREQGEISENVAYHQARQRQEQIEAKIAMLEEYLSAATIIDPREAFREDRVSFGIPTRLKNLDTDEEKVFRVVGEMESDVFSGKISFKSPLGKEILGKEVGEDVEVITPGGERYWEILEVIYE